MIVTSQNHFGSFCLTLWMFRCILLDSVQANDNTSSFRIIYFSHGGHVINPGLSLIRFIDSFGVR